MKSLNKEYCFINFDNSEISYLTSFIFFAYFDYIYIRCFKISKKVIIFF